MLGRLAIETANSWLQYKISEPKAYVMEAFYKSDNQFFSLQA